MTHNLLTRDRSFRRETLRTYERNVGFAIQVMHLNLGDDLTIDELADAAFMSRFHFSRIFAKITGVSPGRFLAALRIQEAKRRLIKTDCSVTDISLDVGYNSLGTFTRIFSEFVGIPPIRFRELSKSLLSLKVHDVVKILRKPLSSQKSLLYGNVICDRSMALITAASFPTKIPKSRPLECVCMTDTSEFAFCRMPANGIHIYAAGMVPSATFEDAILLTRDTVQVGTKYVPSSGSKLQISISLRDRTWAEPPVLVAFPLFIADSLKFKQQF